MQVLGLPGAFPVAPKPTKNSTTKHYAVDKFHEGNGASILIDAFRCSLKFRQVFSPSDA
jgi:hypothetical protein